MAALTTARPAHEATEVAYLPNGVPLSALPVPQLRDVLAEAAQERLLATDGSGPSAAGRLCVDVVEELRRRGFQALVPQQRRG